MKSITTIIGARPQFIKAAPVCEALKKFGLKEVLVHTGQHYDELMSNVFFEQLSMPVPALNLGVGSGSHAMQTAEMMKKLDILFSQNRPDAVLVYGDTNSTLAGALTASKLNIPVIHVEAGLRSFNKDMPEEQNRIITDHLSEFLLCPTHSAIENLRNENIKAQTHLIGDTMYDAVKMFLPKALSQTSILARLGIEDKEYLLATVHRPYNTDDKAKLSLLINSFMRSNQTIVMPIHPRLKRKLTQFSLHLPGNVISMPPVSYFDMLILQHKSRAIMTDSGGIQKEAYFLEKPCITLRPETEWMETVKAGCNQLAWDTEENIITAIEWALNAPHSEFPQLFGDGRAADAAAQIIKEAI